MKMINIELLNRKIRDKNTDVFKQYNLLFNYIFNNINYNDSTYDCWENFFVYCYGNLKETKKSANTKRYLETISKLYSIDVNLDNIHQVMCSLYISYMILLKLIYYSYVVKEETIFDYKLLEILLNGELVRKKTEFIIWGYDFDYMTTYFDKRFLIIINNLYFELCKLSSEFNNKKEIFYSDVFRELYEYLFPKEIRHALGEYYTPSWLSEEILKDIKIEDTSVVIDPTCGSGVFLEGVIKNNNNCRIFGFDLNPLAVLTTKIVLTYCNGVKDYKIYENDILMYPDLICEQNLLEDNYDIYIYGNKFECPFDTFKNKNKTLQFYKEKIYNNSDYNNLEKNIYYNKIRQRIESFFIDKCDYAVGNPPWINWEYLPIKAKELTKKIWIDYNLFTQHGKNLAFSKEDISLLVTYIAIDKLLVDNGRLLFVLRTGSFKSKQNGSGFRNFKLGLLGPEFKVIKVEDYSKVNVFAGAINTACVAIFEKNAKTIYPVPYYECTLDHKKIIKKALLAIPTTDEINSLWLTTTTKKLNDSKNILGNSEYKARTGVFTGGANAVYWIKILGEEDDNHIIIENYTERAKRKAEKITAIIEKKYVYKLCRGSNLGNKIEDDIYIICPHTKTTKMKAVESSKLKKDCPKMYEYFLKFKNILDDRKGFASWEKNNQLDNFYAIQRIGDYTFSPYKVAWKYISKTFDVFIISSEKNEYLGNKIIIPSEKIMYVSFNTIEEAGYVAGILSSQVVKDTIEGFMTETSVSTHVLDKIKIIKYDIANSLHVQISKSYLNNEFNKLNELIKKYYNIS